ncbi:MAG TPA: hypothetical protein VF242_09430 [Nitrososphaeraceae archaeon]
MITVSVSVPISGGGVGGVGIDDDNILCSLSLLFIHLKRNSLSKPNICSPLPISASPVLCLSG